MEGLLAEGSRSLDRVAEDDVKGRWCFESERVDGPGCEDWASQWYFSGM